MNENMSSSQIIPEVNLPQRFLYVIQAYLYIKAPSIIMAITRHTIEIEHPMYDTTVSA